jgi:hypothetical protein
MAAKVGKATAARRQAEAAAKAAGQTPAQVKQAGLDARAKVDPRLASTETVYRPGGGDGKGLVGASWATSAQAPGIRRGNSKQTATGTAAAPAPAAAPSAAPAPTYDPTPLTISGAESYQAPEIKFPEAPPQMFAPGGAGAGVDGNAGGFRRKKSSGRMAGLTSKGTSQFKITGQSGKSSGLNIGA